LKLVTEPASKQPGYMIWLSSNNIDQDLKQIYENGGIVTQSRNALPLGEQARFIDTEGNVVALVCMEGTPAVPTKTIEQKVTVNGKSAKDIYDMFLDSKQHADMTGTPATVSSDVAGQFVIAGGYIEGRTIELDSKTHTIIQSWRAKDWPVGHFSIVTFGFADGPRKSTIITLKQEGVPEDKFEDLSKGWYKYYWGRLNPELAKLGE